MVLGIIIILAWLFAIWFCIYGFRLVIVPFLLAYERMTHIPDPEEELCGCHCRNPKDACLCCLEDLIDW